MTLFEQSCLVPLVVDFVKTDLAGVLRPHFSDGAVTHLICHMFDAHDQMTGGTYAEAILNDGRMSAAYDMVQPFFEHVCEQSLGIRINGHHRAQRFHGVISCGISNMDAVESPWIDLQSRLDTFEGTGAEFLSQALGKFYGAGGRRLAITAKESQMIKAHIKLLKSGSNSRPGHFYDPGHEMVLRFPASDDQPEFQISVPSKLYLFDSE